MINIIIYIIVFGVLIWCLWNRKYGFQEIRKKSDELDRLKNELEIQIENNIKKTEESHKRMEDSRRAVFNIVEDLDNEKKIAEESSQELIKYKLAVEKATDQIVITDPEGVVVYANPATKKITGFDIAEIIGKKAGSKELWGGLMPKTKYDYFWKTIKTDKRSFRGEFENRKKDGVHYFVETQVTPILDSAGKVSFFVAIERDITKTKEIDRMKTDFISLASHQLRTPLSAMKWFLEMFESGDMGLLTKEQREGIDNINQSNERMILLVNSLLNISRIESGRIIVDPINTDIKELTKKIVEDLKKRFDDKKQNIEIQDVGEIPEIKIDQKLVREVFNNLLTNANKYTPNGGKVRVTLSCEGSDLMVKISDNGLGIPDMEKEQIFGRFYRATNVIKKETDGTGLGLYLCKAIISSSGGKIGFESKENEGTTFWFTLPLKGVERKEGVVSLS